MYKTLLVPVDGRSRSARSLELAGRIANDWESHVVGLYVGYTPYIPSTARAGLGSELLAEYQGKVRDEQTSAARAQFDAGVKAAGIAGAEWRTEEGDLAFTVALHARYADLVVVNQTDPAEDRPANFADEVVLALGRPMLIVPYVGEFKSFAQDILVCWNASREAARAVTDALPLLQRAKRVIVLSVDGNASPGGHGEAPGSDIALYLARHGVRAEAARTGSGGLDIGSVILSRAFDYSADLIVMGAYGHSRMREIVLGGATRSVLKSMTVPVLMSH